MSNRWGILAVLFIVRLTMAFQFQSVAAVAPLLGTKFDASLADIGLLIGLYFTPGVALSLPGGAIGKRFGDKATVSGALLLMLIGQLAMVAVGFLGLANCRTADRRRRRRLAQRLDVENGHRLVRRQGNRDRDGHLRQFVAGRRRHLPFDVARDRHRSMVSARSILSVAALIGLGILLLVVGYRSPSIAAAAPSAAARLDRNTLFAVIIAGLIWGVFNIGFAMIFSFGPTLLVERGWSITAAGSAISIVLWLAALSGTAGGFLADWTRRPQSVLVIGCVLFALLMLVLPRSAAVIPVVIAIGLISALPAGPIMSLPARVLQPQTRAIGMGIFYTAYYAAMMLGPAIAGAIAKWTGSAAAAFDFGDGGPARLPGIALGIQPDCSDAHRTPRDCPHFMQPPITHR